VPSIISAISVVKENNFKIHAERVVTENKNLGKCFIYDHKATYSRKDPKLELFLAGETLTDEAKERLYKSAEEYGITRSQIVFHEDATSIRQEFSEKEIVKGIYEQTDKQIKALNDSIASLTASLSDYQSKEIPVETISKELFAQYPDITEVSLSRGASVHVDVNTANEQIIAFITTSKPMDADLHDRIERWLKVRLNNENTVVVNQVEE
jgi:transcriptional regulator NrdR family protein